MDVLKGPFTMREITYNDKLAWSVTSQSDQHQNEIAIVLDEDLATAIKTLPELIKACQAADKTSYSNIEGWYRAKALARAVVDKVKPKPPGITPEEVEKLQPGVYRVYWLVGGVSLAAVGHWRHDSGESGVWLVPCNWMGGSPEKPSTAQWSKVARVEQVDY